MTKIQMRNLWFQVHKWIGLILAILIIPLCVTGSALVWDEPVNRFFNPDRFATTGSATLAPETYAAAAQAVLKPGERIASLRMPEQTGDPIVIAAAPQPTKVQGPAPRTNVYLDPPTAKVLEVSNSRSGVVMVMHMIHGSFMIPGLGRQIVGWIGVAMLVSSFTGLWLWWPTVGKWVRGLRWRRHRNLDTNLHHLMGFWIALPLFVLSLTGAWISFPTFFGPMVGEGARSKGAGPDRAALARAKPLEAPKTPLSAAVADAVALAPGEVRQVTWPTDLKVEWAITVKGKGKPANVTIDDAAGVAKLAKGPDRPQGGVARLMRQVHDGTDTGIVWQTIIFLGGLLPALLAITGVIMWWRARSWKGQLKARQRTKVVAAE